NGQVSRVIVCGLASILFFTRAIAAAFWLDALTFAVMFGVLVKLPYVTSKRPVAHAKPIKRIIEGWGYVIANRPLMCINAIWIISEAFAYSIFFFPPELSGTPENYGLVMAGAGSGFVLGCVAGYTSMRFSSVSRGRLYVSATMIHPLPLLLCIYGAPNATLMI